MRLYLVYMSFLLAITFSAGHRNHGGRDKHRPRCMTDFTPPVPVDEVVCPVFVHCPTTACCPVGDSVLQTFWKGTDCNLCNPVCSSQCDCIFNDRCLIPWE